MQSYQFIASSYPLQELSNSHLVLLSSREIEENKIPAGDVSETFPTTDPDEKNFLYFGGGLDDSDEGLEILPDEPGRYAHTYTEKPFISEVKWQYSNENAKHLIAYIREHMEETGAVEVEVWNIRTDDTQTAKIKTCSINDVSIEMMQLLLGNNHFESPEGLIITWD